MRWKSTFSAMFAVLLLVVSSLAPVCETACTLQGIGSECHRSGGSSNAQASHAHCMHMSEPADSGTGLLAKVDATTHCHHMVCRQTDGLIVKGIQPDEMQLTFIQCIPADELGFGVTSFKSETPPPVIVPLFSPLSVALRI